MKLLLFDVSKIDKKKTTSFNLSPNAGYFFSDGFLGGVSLSTAITSTKNGDFKTTSTLFSLGPFVRYYGDLPTNKNLN